MKGNEEEEEDEEEAGEGTDELEEEEDDETDRKCAENAAGVLASVLKAVVSWCSSMISVSFSRWDERLSVV